VSAKKAVEVPLPKVKMPRFPLVEKRSVEEDTSEKRVLVVAAVPVALPKRRYPMFAFVEKRLVELAVVEKKLVVVALVPVALRNVKFWRVEEPVTRREPSAAVVKRTSSFALEVVDTAPMSTWSVVVELYMPPLRRDHLELPLPAPVASFASQRSALPVMVWQKPAHVEEVTPLKVKRPVMS
jgi:hypothetical protein